MANILIFNSREVHDMAPGQIVTLGENGSFDTVTERKYFGGGITETYAKAPIAGTWICIGLSDIDRLPGAQKPVIATITWRGLKDSSQINLTDTIGVKEASYDSLAFVPSAPNNLAVKANVYDLTYGKSIRSIHTSAQTPPTLAAGGEGRVTATNTQGVTLTDRAALTPISGMTQVWNHPWGWLPYGWQQEEPVKGIFFVSGEYRWFPKFQYG